jgi:hypothetical protein
MDAETRQRIEDVRRDVRRDRDRLDAKLLGLLFLWQPKTHPHPDMLWSWYSIPCVAEEGWYQPGGQSGEQFLCTINGVTQDDSEDAAYHVFFEGGNKEACAKWRQHACEVAGLLERLGIPNILAVWRECELVRTLFELNRNANKLVWTENEQPGHPETKSHVATLTDVYGATESFLSMLLAEIDVAAAKPATVHVWHEADACPPSEYSAGPLTGTKKQLAWWVMKDDDPRNLDTKINNGIYWGRTEKRTQFSIWFRTQEKFSEANQHRIEDSG